MLPEPCKIGTPGAVPAIIRAALALAVFGALQGCAVLPEGSIVGMYFRVGYEQNRTMNFEWTNEPRDLDWQCPVSADGKPQPGVPTWMQCDAWPVLQPRPAPVIRPEF